MATVYGINSLMVTTSMIESVTITGGTITAQTTNSNSEYEITFRHDLSGCGGPDSGILILLKNTIQWTRISFEWLGNGTAACWSFMEPGSNFGSATGTGDGNLLAYNESLGDVITKPNLTWEVPEYQSHGRTYACDNDANNFFRFNSSSFKSFRMTRRRNVNGSLAGIHHGRSCNSTSSSTIIRNIRIWL
jgi:hypothetical protein